MLLSKLSQLGTHGRYIRTWFKVSLRSLPLLILLPFFANDFGFILLQRFPKPFFGFDYTCRLAALALVMWGLFSGHFKRQSLLLGTDIPTGMSWRGLLLLSVGLSVVGVSIHHGFDAIFPAEYRGFWLYRVPYPDTTSLKLFDQTVGLALVAFSEELTFRGVLFSQLQRGGLPRAQALLTQTVLFALTHWGLGPGAMLFAWLWCLPVSVSLLYFRSLWPGVISHYVTDFVAFY